MPSPADLQLVPGQVFYRDGRAFLFVRVERGRAVLAGVRADQRLLFYQEVEPEALLDGGDFEHGFSPPHGDLERHVIEAENRALTAALGKVERIALDVLGRTPQAAEQAGAIRAGLADAYREAR